MTAVADLKPDPRNARKHTPRNVGMIEDSIQRDGFGRSILTAKDGTIIAGNATVEAAVSAGLVKVRTIETTGDEVIEVRRTDVEPGSKQFHNLAVADNRTPELAGWDAPNLGALIADDLIDVDRFWFDPELDKALARIAEDADFDPAAEWVGMPEYENDPQKPVKQITVSFATVDDLETFSRLIGQKVTLETRSVWYPARNLESIRDKAYVNAAD